MSLPSGKTVFITRDNCRLEIDIPPPLPSIIERPSSHVTLLNGTVRMQRARASSRRWMWTVSGGPDKLSTLLGLEQGTFGLPFRWYDPWAARVNLLPAEIASPGTSSDPAQHFVEHDHEVSRSGFVSLDDGQCANVSIAPTNMLMADLRFPRRDHVLDPVPVLPNTVYTASMYVASPDAITLTIVWLDVNGLFISTSSSGPGTAGRIHVTATSPSGAASALISVTFSGIQEMPSGITQAMYTENQDGDDVHMASTSDKESLRITGSIDLRWFGAIAEWPPGPYPFDRLHRIVWKTGFGAGEGAYRFSISNSGNLVFNISSNGTNNFQATSSIIEVPPFYDIGLRVTWSHITKQVRFLRSDDNGATWQLISTDTINVDSIFPGTFDLQTGQGVRGFTKRLEVRDGIDGQIRANPNFTLPPWSIGDAAPVARTDGIGNEWTLIEDALIAGVPRIAGLQLNEGELIPWHPGMGVPRLAFAGGAQTYTALMQCARSLRELTVELVEV